MSDPTLTSQRIPRKSSTRAMSLLELLVVLGVIALLSALLMPSLQRAREGARRAGCLNNLRQLLISSLLYAHDNARGSYTTDTRGRPNQRLDEDDDLSHLFPAAIPAITTFVCPSTKNRVRRDLKQIDPLTGQTYLQDLAEYNHGPQDPGMSYECFGVMAWTRRKTIQSVNTQRLRSTRFNLQGLRPGPSQIWLVLDGQRGFNNLAEGNHGSAGANVGFCDGHAAWIGAAQWERSYEISQDEGDQSFPLAARVGRYE